MKKIVILVLVFMLLATLNDVDAYYNRTCIDDYTLMVNISSETQVNNQWINESSIEYFYCELGCSTVDGARCREVIKGAVPMEVYLFLQILAFVFLINSYPFKTAIRKNEEGYNYSEVIWPMISTVLFFLVAFLNIGIFSPSTGQIYTSMYLFYLNFFLGFIMAALSFIYSFNIWNHLSDSRRGLA